MSLYRVNAMRNEQGRIDVERANHHRKLTIGLPYPKPTTKQKALAQRRINSSVDATYNERISD